MKKYKIGYTTGVFDLFHIGHLNILKNAKSQCEYLIVGVSTDELVAKYKNKLPVIPYNQRAEIISSIKYVDMVVPQVSLDKMDAYNKFKFNVLFHGDDWKNSDLYEEIEKELKKHGVDIVFIPHTDGISTTIIKKMLVDKSGNLK